MLGWLRCVRIEFKVTVARAFGNVGAVTTLKYYGYIMDQWGVMFYLPFIQLERCFARDCLVCARGKFRTHGSHAGGSVAGMVPVECCTEQRCTRIMGDKTGT